MRTLSWKLTLCSMGMMLCMWLAVGVVLVWSTAHEIMDGSMDLAQAQVQEYSHDSYLQTYYTNRKTGFNRWWLENGCEMQIDFLFPRTNREAHARYLQYNLFSNLTLTPSSKQNLSRSEKIKIYHKKIPPLKYTTVDFLF